MLQCCLAKVLLFNRRRSGEVSRIRFADWKLKTKANPSNELKDSLNAYEKSLLNSLERLEIKGKRERTVPILFTEEMNVWMKLLVDKRPVYISTSNPYLFASFSDESYVRGSDVLRKFSDRCGAKLPHLLRSVKLRKHIGTHIQILNLTETEMDMVADFMGHDIRVHKEFYRLPNDVIQVAKLSKVFLAAERGHIGKYAGKSLADITIEGEELIEEIESVHEGAAVSPEQSLEIAADETVDLSEESVSKKQRRTCIKKAWSIDEKAKVANHFAQYIVDKILPGRSLIEKFKIECEVDRPWTDIKDHIRNRFFK